MANDNKKVNITLVMKKGEPIILKGIHPDHWGIPAPGAFFYVEFNPVVTHEDHDYYEDKTECHYYPIADIKRVDMEVVNRLTERREIFELKRDRKNGK